VLYAPYGAVARFDKVKARLLRRKEKGILRLRKPTVEVREGGREGGSSGPSARPPTCPVSSRGR
jgi:hypothetical protein